MSDRELIPDCRDSVYSWCEKYSRFKPTPLFVPYITYTNRKCIKQFLATLKTKNKLINCENLFLYTKIISHETYFERD